MGIVVDKLLDKKVRPDAVKDCIALVHSEVSSKKGIKGLFVKTGYKAFKAVKPSIVKDSIEILFDDFVRALDKHYAEFCASGQNSFENWVEANNSDVAEDLLSIADKMVSDSNHKTVKKVYAGLHKTALSNIAQAAPKIAKIVEKHINRDSAVENAFLRKSDNL